MDILQAEYMVCHELLHLRVPGHNRFYRLLLSRHIPDWREREDELGRWVLALAEAGLRQVSKGERRPGRGDMVTGAGS